MRTQVLIQTLPNSRFRVTGIGRFAVSAEADTREDAIAAFQSAVVDVELTTVEIPVSDSGATASPSGNARLLASIGRGRDIPESEWQDYQATLRRLRDEENAPVFV
jgi:hypothetical protein